MTDKSTTSTSSSVKNHLQVIRRDVQQLEVTQNAAGQVLLAWWLNPLKNVVADPVLGFAEQTVQAVTSVIPFSDPIIGFGLGVTSDLGHLVHGIGCKVGVLQDVATKQQQSRGLSEEVLAQEQNDLSRDFEDFFRDDSREIASPNNLVEAFLGWTMDMIAFLWRAQQISQWLKTANDFKVYLVKSGLGLESLQEVVTDLVPNLILLSRLQNTNRNGKRRVYSETYPTPEEIKDGECFIKFAMAAYVMTGVDVEDTKKKRVDIQQRGLFGSMKKFSLERERTQAYVCDEPFEYEARARICNYIPELSEKDVDMFCKQGIVTRALRHFVAVNHVRKEVVLSIRGTFSPHEMLLMGYHSASTQKYCGGHAHSGMAHQADKLWNVVQHVLHKRLQENPRYSLVLVGHGLGGGVATLLTLKLYHNNKQLLSSLNNSNGNNSTTVVKCHAFGSPPVFYPLEAAPKEALQNTFGYIHDDDVVPFLSPTNVAELTQALQTIQSGTCKTSSLTKLSMILGKREPPAELVKQVVNRGSSSMNKTRAKSMNGVTEKPLLVPASRILWMRGNVEEGYRAFVFDPRELPTTVHVDVDMLHDHFPTGYQKALKMLSIQKGYWSLSSLSKLAQIHSSSYTQDGNFENVEKEVE